MKIFYMGRYNPTENLSGPEKAAKRLFTELLKVHEVVFIEYFFDGRKYSLFKKLFGKHIIEKVNSSTIIQLGLISLFFFLLKEKPTTIHIINFERFVVIAYIYKLLRKVYILYGFQGVAYYENLHFKKVTKWYLLKDKLCEKIIFRYSDKLIFLSKASASLAAKYFNFDISNISIIPNGVDEIFNRTSAVKRFTRDGCIKIVFIGSIERKEKGFEFLKTALKKITFSFELYALCNEKEFTESNFLNVPKLETDKLAEFLLDKDVYISSSNYEPFSIAAAECMAAGLVSIMTEETGAARYVTDGVNGFVIKFNDEERLIRLLNRLNNDRELLPQISSESKKIYGEVSWKKVLEKYKIFYV
ncbi:MAG: glycosyltransferase family 4 protein [bacterium]|nr:glycosyltransferase family 4 protein [bacterium]